MDQRNWECEAVRIWGVTLENLLRRAGIKQAITGADMALAAWKKQFPAPTAAKPRARKGK